MNQTIRYRLDHQLDQIDHLISGLSEAFLREKHLADKWSIFEQLAHLGRYQEVFGERLEAILQTEGLEFERYRADEDLKFREFLALETTELLRRTREARSRLTSLIKALSSPQLERTGIHPKLGQMNILEWTEFFLLHEAHHLYSIFWLIMEFRA